MKHTHWQYVLEQLWTYATHNMKTYETHDKPYDKIWKYEETTTLRQTMKHMETHVKHKNKKHMIWFNMKDIRHTMNKYETHMKHNMKRIWKHPYENKCENTKWLWQYMTQLWKRTWNTHT